MLGQLIKKVQKQEKAGLILVQKSRFNIGNGKSSIFDFREAIQHGMEEQNKETASNIVQLFSNLKKLVNMITIINN